MSSSSLSYLLQARGEVGVITQRRQQGHHFLSSICNNNKCKPDVRNCSAERFLHSPIRSENMPQLLRRPTRSKHNTLISNQQRCSFRPSSGENFLRGVLSSSHVLLCHSSSTIQPSSPVSRNTGATATPSMQRGGNASTGATRTRIITSAHRQRGESSPSKDIHEEEEGVVATEVEPAVDIKGHSIKSYSYAYIYIYI
jgi:hypothetical protein